jgi:hypothetical protein
MFAFRCVRITLVSNFFYLYVSFRIGDLILSEFRVVSGDQIKIIS